MKFGLPAKRLAVVMSLCLVALTGCLDDAIYKPTNQFNYKEVEWATKRGTNTVTGKINAPGSDGKSYTCDMVGLAPDSAYVHEILVKRIGTLEDTTVFKKDLRCCSSTTIGKGTRPPARGTAAGAVISPSTASPMASGISR